MLSYSALQRLTCLEFLCHGPNAGHRSAARTVSLLNQLQWFQRPIFSLRCTEHGRLLSPALTKRSPIWLRRAWRATLLDTFSKNPQLLPWLFPNDLNLHCPEHREALLNLHFQVVARVPALLYGSIDPMAIDAYFYRNERRRVAPGVPGQTCLPDETLLNALPNKVLAALVGCPVAWMRSHRDQYHYAEPRDFTGLQMTLLNRSRALRSAFVWLFRHLQEMLMTGITPLDAFTHIIALTRCAPYSQIKHEFDWPRNLFCLYCVDQGRPLASSRATDNARAILAQPFCFHHLPKPVAAPVSVPATLKYTWVERATEQLNHALTLYPCDPVQAGAIIDQIQKECSYANV